MPKRPPFAWGCRCLAAALLAAANALAWGQEVRVAVAANFAAPMRQIAAAFERETGHRAVVAIGSTGSFYAQIRHGAPFQVLIAADAATPRRLEQEGLAVPGSRLTYAVGRLALWSARPGVVDEQGRVLEAGQYDRIAVANPRLAPYGAAAMQVMERRGVLAAVGGKLVQGESVAQAYQFVATGNAALGFVALSQVQAEGRITSGSAWVIPQALHDPILQEAVLLIPGRDQPAARALLAYLRSAPARAVLRAHGYAEPPA